MRTAHVIRFAHRQARPDGRVEEMRGDFAVDNRGQVHQAMPGLIFLATYRRDFIAACLRNWRRKGWRVWTEPL